MKKWGVRGSKFYGPVNMMSDSVESTSKTNGITPC